MTASKVPASRPLEPQRKAIVIGASSGIGAALVRRLAAQGYTVAALARRERELNRLCGEVNQAAGQTRALPFVHDVRQYEEVPHLFQTITRDLDGLDLIVYVAGIQPPIALTEYNFAKDADMMAVNVLGAMAWLNQAAARFERAQAGQIVGISSIAGDRGRRAFPGYHTSKGALSIYLESLRNRLDRYDVTVTTVKPGFVDTPLLANAEKTFWVISPEAAARQITEAVRRRKQTVYIPGRWGLVSLVIRHIPSVIFRRMSL